MKRALWFCALAVLATGCIRKETSDTLYLEPDGVVTVMVLEKDIRSDAGDPQRRAAEEEEFLAPCRSGAHDVALALTELGAEGVETRILREVRPYMVATEARFDSLDRMFQSFFDRLEAPVSAEIHWSDDRARLTISCDLERLEEVTRSEGEGEEIDVLLTLLADDYRVVLTEGKFLDARGFELKEDGTVAIFLEQSREEVEAIEDIDENGAIIVYSLTWTIPHES